MPLACHRPVVRRTPDLPSAGAANKWHLLREIATVGANQAKRFQDIAQPLCPAPGHVLQMREQLPQTIAKQSGNQAIEPLSILVLLFSARLHLTLE